MSNTSPNSERDLTRICLIGYRGTGKTAVAKQLAAHLGWKWVDADHEVEAVAGRTIAQIFAVEGEEYFRDLESRTVASLMGVERRVVALGGGAILCPENRRLIADSGSVVWLQAAAETIHQRLTSDPQTASQRPNLTTDGGLPEILHVLQQREPLYRECADLVVDTEDKDVAAVATEILQRLQLNSDSA